MSRVFGDGLSSPLAQGRPYGTFDGGGVGFSKCCSAAYGTGAMGSLPSQADQKDPGRHSEGSNFLLADGHVKWLRGIAVSNGDTATGTNCDQDQSGCSPTHPYNQIFGSPGTDDNAASTDASRWTATFSSL